MADDPFWTALTKQYDRIYNPEANKRALEEKAKLDERRAAFKAMFPDRDALRRDR